MTPSTSGDARVHVVAESFAFNGRSITGQIYLRTDETCFPCEGWSDFPVVVLDWWMRELTGDAVTGRHCIRCSFMDGPYDFEILPEVGRWELRYRDPPGPARCWRLPNDGVDFLASLREAAALAVGHCRRQGWETEDITRLAARL